MAQQETTIPTKSNIPPNNTIHDKPEEVNELNSIINSNAQDFEDRATVLENTDVSDIPSYSTASLPTSGSNLTTGKLAYNTDPNRHKDQLSLLCFGCTPETNTSP